ncbi:MAG: DUF1848 domain-containing protein [Eubacteriaceae bacterium]|nr:DUF1848 domain-containing protein [Eubacteriaceae bacterium]
MIISASRRTDIPAFYSDWFIERIKQGYACIKNPMNAKQIKTVSLKPQYVDCIVFWTKNAAPLMSKLKILDELGYIYYFLWTITPYGKDIEKNLPDKEGIISNFIKLSEMIDSNRVILRYDPIITNDKYTEDFHVNYFKNLTSELSGYTNKCIISFVDIYNKLSKQAKEIIGSQVDNSDMFDIANKLNKIAQENNITVQTCCEEIDLSRAGLSNGACIDIELIENLCRRKLNISKAKSQRQLCNCAESVDIGAYNCCAHGCVYCYANSSERTVNENIKNHDINSPFLIGR